MSEMQLTCTTCEEAVHVIGEIPEAGTIPCPKCGNPCPVHSELATVLIRSGRGSQGLASGGSEDVSEFIDVGPEAVVEEPPAQHRELAREPVSEGRLASVILASLVLLLLGGVVAGVVLFYLYYWVPTRMRPVSESIPAKSRYVPAIPGRGGPLPGLPVAIGAGGQKPPVLCLQDKDHIELSDTASLLDLDQSFSVEMWAQVPSLQGNAVYLIGDAVALHETPASPKKARRGWAFRLLRAENPDDYYLECVLAAQDGAHPMGQWVSLRSDAVRSSKGWRHFAVSKKDDTVTLFVNGKALTSKTFAKVKGVPSPSNLHLGAPQQAAAGYRSNLTICAFRLSSVPRPAKAFQPARLFRKEKGDLILLDFRKGHGKKQIPDVSGKKHHGKIVGGKWTR